jgi:predicted secreted protein
MPTAPALAAAAGAALALTLFLPGLSARAGDMAALEVLGFSPDGGMFAFEEFGVQDGSGFPYANRFYIHTATDSFVAGTPVRVRIDDENATVEAARGEAKARGQRVIADATLSEHRGFAAGMNAVTELSADPFRMAVNPRPVVPPIDAPLEFRLEETAVGSPERCRDLGEIKGFRLVRVATEPGGQARLIHEDSGIPQSRGCPLGYAIAGVQTFFPETGDPVFALMIAVRSFGFEGPDHRFIAVTGPIGD